MMINLLPDSSIYTLWFIFMGVYFVLQHLVFKPTFEIMDERNKRTHIIMEEVAALTSKTKKDVEIYEKKIAEVRLDASKIRERIVQEGVTQQRVLVNDAKKKSEAVLDDLRADISKEKKEVTLQLKQYSQELASDVVSKILNKVA